MAAIALGEEPSMCTTVNEDKATITVGGDVYESRKFAFDRVLNERASQIETYHETAAGVIKEVLRGFNGAVLAYGQTGTGKTHTMFGNLQYKDRREPLGRLPPNQDGAERFSRAPLLILSQPLPLPLSLRLLSSRQPIQCKPPSRAYEVVPPTAPTFRPTHAHTVRRQRGHWGSPSLRAARCASGRICWHRAACGARARG